jgi:ribosome-associated translation inhibitor RaiA
MIKKLIPKLNNSFIEEVSFHKEKIPLHIGITLEMVSVIKMKAKVDGKDICSLCPIDYDGDDEILYAINKLIESLERWLNKNYKKKDLISFFINSLNE